MNGWRLADIEKLQNRGMVAGTPHVFVARETLARPQIKIPREEAKPLTAMKQILKFMQVDFVTEYKFSDRKFRFDIAIPEKMIAVEYEGLMSEKSVHTTITGFSGNCDKYNLAVLNGWKLLRYTVLNYNQFLSDINKLLK